MVNSCRKSRQTMAAEHVHFGSQTNPQKYLVQESVVSCHSGDGFPLDLTTQGNGRVTYVSDHLPQIHPTDSKKSNPQLDGEHSGHIRGPATSQTGDDDQNKNPKSGKQSKRGEKQKMKESEQEE